MAARREPALDRGDVALVTQTQVFVRDALASGEQTIGKLLGLELGVAVYVLEPFGGVARRILDFEDLDGPFGFVVPQRGEQIGLVLQGARQRDRVLERELGARPDREMRGVRGVTEQYDRRARGVADPGPVD